jgi:hypothetical protein
MFEFLVVLRESANRRLHALLTCRGITSFRYHSFMTILHTSLGPRFLFSSTLWAEKLT